MKKFKAHSERLLKMMINSVYTNKEIFLRELISNASDAIDKAKFLSLTQSGFETDFCIKIQADKENRTLSVVDNGIGMDEKELENNLGTIAESGTANFKENQKESQKENQENQAGIQDGEKLIGQFGVGFYSAFMVAKKIEVYTKKSGGACYKWASDATGYTIDLYESSIKHGTEIKLFLKEPDEDMDYNELTDSRFVEELIKKYSDYIRYPIYVFGADKPANSMVPIWKRAKEAKKEELDEFFRHKYYFDAPPLKTVSYSIEGAVSYKALLFIPSVPPYDYFSAEYERGISLYNSGVMIMENCKELLPDYLGFVKGVIETEDISLNISRELMQKDRNLTAISKSIEKKVLSELEKMLKSERETYEKFFNAFGASIKLGIYSSFGVRKDELKDLLLYYSGTQKTLVSLSEYVSRIGENKNILYACGDDITSIGRMPIINHISKNNVGREVLYLTDRIDEFVVKIINKYGDFPILSVLDKDADTGSAEQAQSLKKEEEDNRRLLADIADILKDKVSSVSLSDKLADYPCALSSSNEISLQMEKILSSVNKENKAVAKRVLELNPFHPVFNKLKETKNLKDLTLVLYYQAVLLSGLNIDEPYELCQNINNLILG